MSDYTLSIGIEGDGEDPNHRSHWGFLIYRPENEIGTLLHVQLLSFEGLIYQYESRTGYPLESQTSEGRVLLGDINPSRYNQVVQIISGEPAPRNNQDRCQDWILDCVIALEAEELLPAATSQWVANLVGKPSKGVVNLVGDRWIPARR
ncbi:uncharacterized protein K460DRAFT_314534 [Cucurbitaria berberidis CBS 394.84]|uniref:Uncharacterized protein n=1 Tax=Cucurbitaria berberidis CBS 394.84 TaxID=1168544 RepID=A0A9P4GCJ4_9PLEO|nr:uncharacterized protein K460DRAFT_314534 [Cucurbitaria berberidis CBS 394.84]KAF1842846.1 hypothetical protein K460DRAFT_314534 [Cucurbitaria berberidis CBS 394.84]